MLLLLSKSPHLHIALDRILRLSWENGIGVERKRAAIITRDIESKLWEAGVIGCHSPQALLHAVSFCLRGTKICVFHKFTDLPHLQYTYMYVEFGSKNHSGGIADRSEGKIVSIVGTGSSFCYISILDK